jgi:hypothetical protein
MALVVTNRDLLDVRLKPAVRHAMRVADIASSLGLLTANLTNLRHVYQLRFNAFHHGKYRKTQTSQETIAQAIVSVHEFFVYVRKPSCETPECHCDPTALVRYTFAVAQKQTNRTEAIEGDWPEQQTKRAVLGERFVSKRAQYDWPSRKS